MRSPRPPFWPLGFRVGDQPTLDPPAVEGGRRQSPPEESPPESQSRDKTVWISATGQEQTWGAVCSIAPDGQEHTDAHFS